MRLRNIPGAREMVAESPYVVQDPAAVCGRWREKFGNRNPVRVEVGTGKGKFINELAFENPQINYVGIEKYSSVLIKALGKLEASQISNLLFIRGDAELICDFFAQNEVDRIYLNFSDPWPKDRHAKRRLPSKEYLRRFDRILVPDGTIEFKTDNRALFDFAVEEVPLGGFKVQQITYDLHNDPVMNAGNIMTEYEEKFSAKGNPIFKYVIGREAIR